MLANRRQYAIFEYRWATVASRDKINANRRTALPGDYALMLFSSHEFIFVFLPLTILFYAIARVFRSETVIVALLVIASTIFYGYYRIDYTLLLYFSITVNFLLGNRLQFRPNRLLLIAGITANLLLLAYFKYFDFFISQINMSIGGHIPNLYLALPLGISFHTFQQIAYLVDCNRGRMADRNFLRYILFVMFFPQLIAGPIVHHAETMPQFARHKSDEFSRNLAIGLTIFAIGLFKKTVIADNLDIYSDAFSKVSHGYQITMIEAWGATVAYTLQIYFDFSAYSDMAIGLARLFGIVMPTNFLSPYKAVNIADFWRRWHITLSRWLRDYLYIPLGGNRKSELRRYENIMITMLLGGLWHGAGWTYVLWGGLHGLYLIIYHTWRTLVADRIQIPGLMAVAVTFLAVTLAWVPFRSPDLMTTVAIYKALFGFSGFELPIAYESHLPSILHFLPIHFVDRELPYSLTNQTAFFAVLLAAVWFLPNIVEIFWPVKPALVPEGYRPAAVFYSWRQTTAWAIGTGVVACLAIAGIDRIVAFIYFQF
jgi:alginate O-acetyltransferase complex protein AlgI